VRPTYLAKLKGLMRRIQPYIVSDHLCWADRCYWNPM
jgi:uncharacterized protein (UPF0276 family)